LTIDFKWSVAQELQVPFFEKMLFATMGSNELRPEQQVTAYRQERICRMVSMVQHITDIP